MAKIFGGFFGAYAKDQSVRILAVTLNSNNESSARGCLMKASEDQFPFREGYRNHFTGVAEVLPSQIDHFNEGIVIDEA